MPTRQQRSKTITRMRQRQILDAALAVFAENGFAMATTAAIARRAGVAEGTIYNYFASKRELIIAAIKDMVITAPLLDLIEKMSQGDVAATFKSILLDRFDLIEKGPVARMPSLVGEVLRDPELKALWQEQFLQPFLAQLDAMYRSIAASGRFRRMEPAIAVRVMAGLVLGFIILRLMEGEASPLDRLPREKVAEEMMQLVFHGLLGEKERYIS